MAQIDYTSWTQKRTIHSWILFLTLAAISLSLRIWIANSAVSGNDMRTWYMFGNLLEEHWSPYIERDFLIISHNNWPYGPVWSYIILGAKTLLLVFTDYTVKALHISLATFLGVVDICIGAVLFHYYRNAGILFLFYPISIYVSSVHIQFDNFAILVGLVSWIFYSRSSDLVRNSLLGGILCGLSLAIKHVLILFPLWILFWDRERSLKARIIFTSTSFCMLLLIFAPYLIDTESYAGVKIYVLGQTYETGRALVPQLLDIAFPILLFDKVLSVTTDFELIKLLFVLMLFGSGAFVIGQRDRVDIICWYCILIVILAPAMATQYLAIPAIGLALLRRSICFWIYTVVTVLYLYGSNILSALPLPNSILVQVEDTGLQNKLNEYFDYWHIQFWLLLAVVLISIRRAKYLMESASRLFKL